MFYLVEVTYWDDTKQIGLAELLRENCTLDCWGIGNRAHNDWDVPKDSPFIEGLVKSIKPIRELKEETEISDMKLVDIMLGNFVTLGAK